MTELHTLIVNRILLDEGVSLSQLEAKAVERNISLNDLYTALDKVHRDKRIQRKVLKGEIHYFKTVTKTPNDYLRWVREHYPYPGRDGVPAFVMPWPEWNLDFMFLKTKEERDAFMVEMKGRQAVYNKKRYDRDRRTA